MTLAWSDLIVAIGLLLVIKGAFFALGPDIIRRLYAIALTQPVPRLRMIGGLAVVTGLYLIWIVRGGGLSL